MRCASAVTALANLAATVSATGILLPLYIYPDNNAAAWQPAYDAIDASSDNSWLVVINPANGPGGTGQPANGDSNYETGITGLNKRSYVQTIGYVRTDYAKSSLDEVKANITNYAAWSGDLAVKGIFFDESATDLDYLTTATGYARDAIDGVVTICNIGSADNSTANDQFYSVCDVVIGFESALNDLADDYPQFKGTTTINDHFDSAHIKDSALIVNHFAGEDYNGAEATTDLLQTYVKEIVDSGLGWFYFATADYDDMTSDPASVGNVASALVSASS